MEQSTVPYCQQHVTLIDGRQALMRPVCHADRDALMALFNRCSPQTRFLRFHYLKPRITDEEMEQYCGVDYYDSFALVAEIRRGHYNYIVGTGIYYRLSRPDTAEVAFMVEDIEQGNGICTHLLELLAAMAKERGITSFAAELLSQNVTMLHIFMKYAPTLKQTFDESSINLTFPI